MKDKERGRFRLAWDADLSALELVVSRGEGGTDFALNDETEKQNDALC